MRDNHVKYVAYCPLPAHSKWLFKLKVPYIFPKEPHQK